ncbi:hypothetical protein DV736_g3926, partial [Chaetothyriales sp. CBS 134916]
MALSILILLATIAFHFLSADAIVLNLNDTQSIRNAAATAAYWMQALYDGNTTEGVRGKFPFPPYYWWESGGAWGGMVNYWHYTGDQSYVNVTFDALISQLGPAYDYVVPSEVFDEGNDDQAFWAFAGMNSISNGGFFQLSARLARYTGNDTYLEWAERIWNWTSQVGLIDNVYNVFDGTDETINCSGIDHHQWTYNVGVFLYGSAVLQNYTNASTIWVERTTGLLEATSSFFSPYQNATDIMFEAQCELDYSCNIDELSMKAYLARWLAGTSQMAPYTAGRIGTLLKASALGAAASCTGGPYGNTCGMRWYVNGFDNQTGLGQQLSATEIFYALLVNDTLPPNYDPHLSIGLEPGNISLSTSPGHSQPGPTAPAGTLFENPEGAAPSTGGMDDVVTFSLTLICFLVMAIF